jgi:hypothetical protein
MAKPTAVDATTYELDISGEKQEIGDKDSVDFKPTAKLYRFGTETSLEISYQTDKKLSPVESDDKVQWNDIKEEIHFYQKDSDSFELEHIYLEKPKSYQLRYLINLDGLVAYKQPPLTQQEIDEGAVRPDNVINSFAFYHATRSNVHASQADADKYKTGKAGHLYRIKLTDADGKESWADDTNIIDSELVIDLPKAFMDSAAYPVYVGPNFGYTSIGESYNSQIEGVIRGSLFTCSEIGTIDKITAHWGGDGHNTKTGCYKHSDDSLVAEGAEVYDDSGWNSRAWHDHTVSGNPAVSAQGYVLCIFGESAAGFLSISFDTGDPNQGHVKSVAYNGFPDPISWAGHGTHEFSIYCIFTTGDGYFPRGVQRISHAFSNILHGTGRLSLGLLSETYTTALSKGAEFMVITEHDKLINALFTVLPTTDITKSAEFMTIVTESIEKNGLFEIITTLSDTVDALFAILPETDKTKTASFTILQHILKLTEFMIAPETDTTKQAEFVVQVVGDISKFSEFTIIPTTDLLKNAQFLIQTTPSITKTAEFIMIVQQAIEKNGLFTVLTTLSKTVDSLFAIMPSTDKTKAASFTILQQMLKLAEFSIIPEADVTKQAEFIILLAGDINKFAEFAVEATINLLKNAQYFIETTANITKNTEFTIQTIADIEKAAQFEIEAAGAITKAALFEIITTVNKTLDALFCIQTTGQILRSAEFVVTAGTIGNILVDTLFSIITGQTLTKSAQFVLNQVITKAAAFAIAPYISVTAAFEIDVEGLSWYTKNSNAWYTRNSDSYYTKRI